MPKLETLLDNHMVEEIESENHLGLSLGVFNTETEVFFNYGKNEGKPISERNYFEIASTSKILTSLLVLNPSVA